MIGKGPLDGSEILFASGQDHADDCSIERRHDLWPVPSPQPACVLCQADIAPIMHTIFDALFSAGNSQ